MIETGAEAPDFTLRDQDGGEVKLADLRGQRVLIAFYPLDFSPVCSDQLVLYKEIQPQLDAAGVKLLGVSVDSFFAHKAFAEKLDLATTLLADFEPKGEVARAYGAYIEATGHANRSLVLIDAEGRVEWVHESPTPLEIPPADLIVDAIGA